MDINPNKIELLGVKITNIKSTELNEAILNIIKLEKKRQLVLNVNINAMNIAYNTGWFREMLNNALINFCDGDGVRLGSLINGKKIAEKITYNRWIWDFSTFCEDKSLSLYLIGSKIGTIKKAVGVLREKYPNLNVIGYHSGYFTCKEDLNSCISDINKKRPNIIILGMGMPLQEKWLMENSQKLHYNVALTGGAVFEYISGEARMTPDIFYKLKLEWFYRFLLEPVRLFKRYFIGNPLFIYRVILERFKFIKFN